jgi:hypothetical protein
MSKSVLEQIQPPLSLKATLKTNSKFEAIKTHILGLLGVLGQRKFIDSSPLVIKTRMTLEMTEFVTNLIENIVGRGTSINKKELAIQILTDIYTLTPEEIIVVNQQIQYIYDSGLICKIPFLDKVKNALWGVLKRISPV